MSKKKREEVKAEEPVIEKVVENTGDQAEEQTPLSYRGKPVSERGWVIRSVAMIILMIAFVLWRLLPVLGNQAYWWAAGMAGLMAIGLGVSYYFLFKKE